MSTPSIVPPTYMIVPKELLREYSKTPPPRWISTPPPPNSPKWHLKSAESRLTPVQNALEYHCENCSRKHKITWSSSDGSVKNYTLDTEERCIEAYEKGNKVYKRIKIEHEK